MGPFCCHLLNVCVDLVVAVSSVKTWAPTPARTMGSPRLSGRTNPAGLCDSFIQLCLYHKFVSLFVLLHVLFYRESIFGSSQVSDLLWAFPTQYRQVGRV